MSHLFISYSRHDIAFVRHLKRLIEAEGLRVWVDETGLRPSQHWWRRILTNIEVSAAMIVVMSPHASESQWVEREVLHADRLHKPIFPVLLAGEVWPMLANIQYADLRAGEAAVLPAAFCEALRYVVADHRDAQERAAARAMLEPDTPLDDFDAESDAPPAVNPRPLSASNAPTILRRPKELDRLIQANLVTKERVRTQPSPPAPIYAEAPTIPAREERRRTLRSTVLFVIAFLVGLSVAWIAWGSSAARGDSGEPSRDVTPSPSAGAETSPAPPSATYTATHPAAPSAIPLDTPVPDLRLLYDDDSFIVVNIAGRTLDISDLVFEQVSPDGVRRYLEARTFDDADTLAPTWAMVVDGCFQLQTVASLTTKPPTSQCPRLLGYFRTGLTRRYFWLADDDSAVTTFVVRHLDDDTILAACAIAAGECEVTLPE